MATNLAAVALVERVGRRFLLAVSAAIMAITLFSLGAFFYFKEAEEAAACGGGGGGGRGSGSGGHGGNQTLPCAVETQVVQNYGWLPLLSLIVYMLGFSIGEDWGEFRY